MESEHRRIVLDVIVAKQLVNCLHVLCVVDIRDPPLKRRRNSIGLLLHVRECSILKGALRDLALSSVRTKDWLSVPKLVHLVLGRRVRTSAHDDSSF